MGIPGWEHEVHPADKAAEILWWEQNGRHKGLPQKFWGVWWMADNAGPELLANLDAFKFHPDKREITILSGQPLSWSHNSDCCGTFGWAGLKSGYFGAVKVHLKFNEDYSFAKMPMSWLCGVPLWNGQTWTMKEIDEDTWYRVTYCCCSPIPSKKSSYTLKKIIDKDGQKMPAFEEMMKQLKGIHLVQGVMRKTLKQIINVPKGGSKKRELPGFPNQKSVKAEEAPKQDTMLDKVKDAIPTPKDMKDVMTAPAGAVKNLKMPKPPSLSSPPKMHFMGKE